MSLEKMACLIQCLKCLLRTREARVVLGMCSPSSCLRIYQSCCLGIYQLCCLGIYQSCCLGIYQLCCLGIYELILGMISLAPLMRDVQHGCPPSECSSMTTHKEDVSVWLPRRLEISFATLLRMICDFLRRGISSLAPRRRLSSFVKTSRCGQVQK